MEGFPRMQIKIREELHLKHGRTRNFKNLKDRHCFEPQVYDPESERNSVNGKGGSSSQTDFHPRHPSTNG